jgi:Glutamate synthase domain 2
MGRQTVYPLTTGANQIASEKKYPLDYSHFNINGRVFGAVGADASYEEAEIYNVDLAVEYGTLNKVKMTMPVIQPAVIKLNWRDYFGGAAMTGVTCMVGEGAMSKDEALVMENGKVTDFPFMGGVIDSFRKYYRGFGQIVPQCNIEDDMCGVPEIALTKYGAEAIEFKFGQSAKGTQPVNRLPDLKTALAKKKAGFLVKPDPDDEDVQKKYDEGVCPNFYMYARLPQWSEEFFAARIPQLRNMGMKNVYFKMAGYDPADLERVLRIAAANQVDMVTFDGAGGGSGYSPCEMMNEWCLPTAVMESRLVTICRKLRNEGLVLPAITVTGGFASESSVFKALALGDGNVQAVGLCRAPMAAAMSAKNVGEAIVSGHIPEQFRKYGTTKEEIFADLADLRALYGKQANDFSAGAVGVFSYLNKIAFGLQHFGALNRKFAVEYFDRSDLIPLTEAAGKLLSE